MSDKILVVDDDPVTRHILTTMIESLDYTVAQAESGETCMQLLGELKQSSALPRVIFLDLQLVDMRGTELLVDIVAFLGDSKIPVVMFSANTEAEMLETKPEILPDLYLEKPFKVETVANAISEVLKTA